MMRDGLTPFGYGKNNPISLRDVSGKQAERKEREFRINLILSMQTANVSGCCSYPSQPFNYTLPKMQWEGQGLTFTPRLLLGVRPSEAINSIFVKGAGSQLDCLTMIVAVQYGAILGVKGPKQFDLMFGEQGPYSLILSTRSPQILESHNFIKKVPIKSSSELRLGDWVYFVNHPDYSKLKPEGFWAGLHALYVGEKHGKAQFQGFGLKKPLSAEDIHKLLIGQYTKAYQEVKGEIPPLDSLKRPDIGLQKWAYRPVIENIMKKIQQKEAAPLRQYRCAGELGSYS
jgi:hypothetical protein